MDYKLVAFEKNEEALAAYQGRPLRRLHHRPVRPLCRAPEAAEPRRNVVLPEIISKEPLGPVVRQGDDAWFNVVKWTYFALVNAEELGITSKNVDEMKTSKNPEVQRLLGVPKRRLRRGFGTGIGLEKPGPSNIIKATGNYGEIFERNVGESSPLKIARGKNALWKDGGLQYAPPIR